MAAVGSVMLALVSIVGANRADAASLPTSRTVRSVIVITVGNLVWADITPATDPSLFALLKTSALGSMSLQGAHRERPTAPEMYATLGAGARAVVDSSSGDCRRAASQIRCARAAAIVRANRAALFGAEPFALGDALQRGGIGRYLVAPCDAACPVALTLANSRGDVSMFGALADGLRVISQPSKRTVVLVAVPNTSALESLLDGGAQSAIAAADAVLIVSPDTHGRAVALTACIVRASQRFRATELRSATTGRAGIVQMIDIAPTILSLFNLNRPLSMEGRALSSTSTRSSVTSLVTSLRDINTDARLRDRMLGAGAAILAVFELLSVSLFLLVALGRHNTNAEWLRSGMWNQAVELTAAVAIAYVPATFLVRLLPLGDAGHIEFWSALTAATLLAATGGWIVNIRFGRSAAVCVMALTFVVLFADGVTGTHLEFNAMFGYSATAGGRFVGFGNNVFGFFATAAVILAAWLSLRSPRWLAVSLLAVAWLVIALPMFGSDVGGAITMLAAALCCAAMLFEVRVRARTAAIAFVGAGALLGGLALLDASRPADHQTHLGRLVHAVTDNGSSELGRVMHRKWDAGLHVLFHSVGTYVLPVAMLVAAAVWLSTPSIVRARLRSLPAARAAIVGVLIVSVLGSIVNDSGISVAGASWSLAIPFAVFSLSRIDRQTVAGTR